MVFGMRSKVALKIFIFICSVIIVMGSYYFGSYAYESLFAISSHKSVGMIFISFFYIYSYTNFVVNFFHLNKNKHAYICIGSRVFIL